MDFVGVLGGTALAAGLGWRFACRRLEMPCPPWMTGLLELPIVEPFNRASLTLAPLDLHPGMRVLDAGCGGGRLTAHLAKAVGPSGEVVAMDLQDKMLAKTLARCERDDGGSVHAVQHGLGKGQGVPVSGFDRIVLVTVLGEIPNRVAALEELRDALAPDGLIAVTEALPDPHFQPRRTAVRLAERAGLEVVATRGRWYAYTLLLRPGISTSHAKVESA